MGKGSEELARAPKEARGSDEARREPLEFSREREREFFGSPKAKNHCLSTCHIAP